MIKRILVGLAGTAFAPTAVRRSIELARAHQAELTAVTILDVDRLRQVGPVPIGAGAAAEDLRKHRVQAARERIESAIAEFETSAGKAGVPYEVHREQGDPFERMTSLARYHDLMICGLRGIFDYGVVPDAQDALARLIREGVRPIIASAEHYREVRRALIAYSGSMEAAKTMKRFVQMRLWPDLTLKIVTFGRSPDEAKELLEPAADYCRAHGYAPETEAIAGSPKRALLEHASRWDADIVVMGNSARSLLLRRILGDTTLHVVKSADRPLFLAQ